MAKQNFILTALLAGLLAGALPLSAQQELNCFISDPDTQGKTNIREKPGGKVIFQVDAADFYQLTVLVQPGGWWKIKDPVLSSFGEDIALPSGEAWIHRSVLAMGTDNSDGHYRFLRTEPRAGAPKAGIIREFNAAVRPLEVSQDGKWVKVKYEEGKLTGWIERSWLRDDAFEPGDGYGFPVLSVYSIPKTEVSLLTAPGKGAQTLVLKKGKIFEMQVAKPKNGWWEVMNDWVEFNEDYIALDTPSWVPASAISILLVSPKEGEKVVPLYGKPDEKSLLPYTMAIGTEVHPLDVAGEYWAEWTKVVADDDPERPVWVKHDCLGYMPPKAPTYVDVEGVYDTADSEMRVCLNKDGTATWNMIGSLNWTDFTYVICGFGIYLDVKTVTADSEPDYIYDPEEKTLDDGEGNIYYLQEMQ